MNPAAANHAADLRLIAFLLARTARAIRSGRCDRGGEFLIKAHALVETLPFSDEKARACTLIEHLAIVGFERQLEQDLGPDMQAAQ